MSATPPSTLSAKLSALTQRLGLGGRSARQVLERAAHLQLPFQPLATWPESIWWHSGAPLQHLPELPRSALSGPVQEDKAAAHAVLVRLVEQQHQQINSFDLRTIDGLMGSKSGQPDFASFEDYISALSQRQVRIISYKDFVNAISQALPRFLAGERIQLNQASWHGSRFYWNGEQAAEVFANAIVYARRRGLEVTLPALINRYRINPVGLEQLDAHYHVLAMPAQAWSHGPFMSLLLDTGMPYARLTLMRNAEFLMLPKQHPQATALGEGLRLAGAADVCEFLRPF